MSEASPNPAQQIAEESTPLANGTPAPVEVLADIPTDIEMADSVPPPEPVQEVNILPRFLNIPRSDTLPASTHRSNRTTHTRACRTTTTSSIVA